MEGGQRWTAGCISEAPLGLEGLSVLQVQKVCECVRVCACVPPPPHTEPTTLPHSDRFLLLQATYA